jgi:preprotein translocase subunit SecD
MQKQRLILGLILLLLLAALTVLVKMPIRLGLDLQGGSQLTIQAKSTAEYKVTSSSLEDIKKVIENRVNGLGVSEPLVQTVGENQILVQLPGISDPKEAEDLLGGTAQLDFREQKPGTEEKFQAAEQKQRAFKQILENIAKSPTQDKATAKAAKEAFKQVNAEILALFGEPKIVGKNLQTATAEPTQSADRWNVGLRFDKTGGDQFAALTKGLAGKEPLTLGIFLDKELLSAATVRDEFKTNGITGGSAVIQGSFKAREAETLAISLRGGALPVPVEIVENRTVGATLGQESIRSSIYAAIGGLMLVLIFMGVYYRVPGLVADVSLIIYTILTLAVFNLLGVTLTLPGIAGFILSIGMAVDANVLIFERTREELRAGKTLYRSVESGFFRAFSSILDGNVTTLIACALMFWFGTGLIKGFAFTLGLGVIISMFTALTCSRTLLLLVVLGFPKLRQKPQLFCPNLAEPAA